jgi:hypothetical protein
MKGIYNSSFQKMPLTKGTLFCPVRDYGKFQVTRLLSCLGPTHPQEKVVLPASFGP